MAPCSTSRLDLAPERRNAFPHPNRPAAGQYVLDLPTRSFDVSCLVLCFFGLHLPLLLPLSDTLLASLLSLTFLSCQHSQALVICTGLVNAKSPMLRKREDKLAGREEESSFFGKI